MKVSKTETFCTAALVDNHIALQLVESHNLP